MTKYKLLEASSAAQLSREINDLIKNGWVREGEYQTAIAHAGIYSATTSLFTQMMSKFTDPNFKRTGLEQNIDYGKKSDSDYPGP
jgi:hypothetical protein